MRTGGVIALAIATIAGCERSDPSDDGPLGPVIGATAVEECSPAQRGDTMTIGDIYITNPTHSALTFTGVSFVATDGATLVGAAIGDNALPLVAAGRGYPPVSVPAEVWDQVEPVAGAVLQPDTGEMVIMIGLRLDEQQGQVTGVRLDYEVDGTSYQVIADRTYSLRTRC
jgi:hypothetical protein